MFNSNENNRIPNNAATTISIDISSANGIELLKAIAERGDAAAQLRLGNRAYARGEFVEARYWFEKAAKNGLGEAYFGLARICKYHYSNLKAARLLFEMGAQKGDSKCQNEFAEILMMDGRTQDALDLFEKSAAQGNHDAKCTLGHYYWKRVYELPSAAFWYHSAAEHGDARAYVNLAQIYQEMRNLPSAWDSLQSALSLQDQINQKHDKHGQIAHMMLGQFFERGLAPIQERDLAKALEHYTIAQHLGHPDAVEAVDRVQALSANEAPNKHQEEENEAEFHELEELTSERHGDAAVLSTSSSSLSVSLPSSPAPKPTSLVVSCRKSRCKAPRRIPRAVSAPLSPMTLTVSKEAKQQQGRRRKWEQSETSGTTTTTTTNDAEYPSAAAAANSGNSTAVTTTTSVSPPPQSCGTRHQKKIRLRL
eukprot:GEZU01000105.1.p1 GENE.GEZU01000105.1~~GEZU01000105.1.p1  ORF type:complete len:423 (+),score=119.49 GEZU01000105.1:1365-2633(+)